MTKRSRAAITVRLDRALLERLRTAGFAARLTIDELVGRSVEAAVAALERRYNQGQPFPAKDRWREQELQQLLHDLDRGVARRLQTEEE